jgi:hypothetical protein
LHRRAFKSSRHATDAETARRYNPKITNRSVHFAQRRLDASIFHPDEIFGGTVRVAAVWARADEGKKR